MMAGDLTSALSSFAQSRKLEPGYVQARFNHAVAQLKMGKFELAATELEPLAAAGALSAAAAYHQALAYDGAGRTDQALLSVNRALKSDPDLVEAIFLLGRIQEKKGDLQAAGRAFKLYLQHEPQSTAAILHFGILAQRSGHMETARRYLRQVIDLSPSSTDAVTAKKFLAVWD